MQEIFKKVTEQISKPITQDELDYMLIENGLEIGLRKKDLTEQMGKCDFYRRQIMVNGERGMYWTRGGKVETKLDKKIRYVNFMTAFLADKTEVDYKTLVDTLRDNGFDADVWNGYFFAGEGIKRNWRGWILTDVDGVKVYKKVEVKND